MNIDEGKIIDVKDHKADVLSISSTKHNPFVNTNVKVLKEASFCIP